MELNFAILVVLHRFVAACTSSPTTVLSSALAVFTSFIIQGVHTDTYAHDALRITSFHRHTKEANNRGAINNNALFFAFTSFASSGYIHKSPRHFHTTTSTTDTSSSMLKQKPSPSHLLLPCTNSALRCDSVLLNRLCFPYSSLSQNSNSVKPFRTSSPLTAPLLPSPSAAAKARKAGLRHFLHLQRFLLFSPTLLVVAWLRPQHRHAIDPNSAPTQHPRARTTLTTATTVKTRNNLQIYPPTLSI
uniref:(northern house mosquito) hypothetical protein n=1 Tax=Culex pipiens TaxID=7175 RepID=A0A8D8D8R8_CULPI